MARWTIAQLEQAWPEVKWREPAYFRLIGDPQKHYACRICIANRGIKGKEIPDLPTSPEPVIAHLRTMHHV